ncbi:hypothetical protein LSAT2_007669 [Lamellibrachia satsuma]|nr:hypothetical protein LSAT2_007669 [Lamellibrachia satsuma]
MAKRDSMIRWSDETYSLSELLDQFQSKFPCIVKVTTGYNGHSPWESLSTEQVIRVHRAGQQERVLGKDAAGRRFSIPVKFSVPFTIADQTSGLLGYKKKYSLATILERNSLPVNVDLVEDSEVKPMSQGRELLRLGSIQLVSTYEERSIVGNMIKDGIMSSLPVAVPIHVKVDVALAEGTTDGDNEVWQTLNADYSQSAALIDYASVPRADDVRSYTAHQVGDLILSAQTASPMSDYFSLGNERSLDQSVYTSLENGGAATSEGSYYNLENTSQSKPRALYQNVKSDAGTDYATCVP